MKVILKQDVKKLGKSGEIIEVAEGYGRNFLLPRGMAVLADTHNKGIAEAQAKSKERKQQQAEDEARLMASQLTNVSVSIPVRIGEGGKLFGSVTGKDVAEALKKQNIDIDRRKISIKGDVTGVGTYEAVIKLYPEITSVIKVEIVEG